jgi:hypothetical protein|tara:strand:+ start:170 stop:301 length:132 start_codon:yes stop_codon:yes gene_type:complete
MTRAWRKKGLIERRQGALDRLLKVKEPNKRQEQEIEILKKRIH